MTGTLFLSGGGDELQSYKLDEAFMHSLKPTPRILYLPFALNRDERGFEACRDWISSTLGSHSKEPINITVWLDVAVKTGRDIRGFDAIYIGGGNTYKLLSMIKVTSFDEVLKQYLAEGGVVYGGSAGAIIFGQTIRTVVEENDRQYKHEAGLGLLGRYSLRCHYVPSDGAAMSALAAREGVDILALPEDAGLILKDGKLSAFGDGITRFSETAPGGSVLQDGQSLPI